MQTDFALEYNDLGTWRPALVLDVTDDNNVSLWYIGEGGQWQPTTGAVPLGTESGHFRARVPAPAS